MSVRLRLFEKRSDLVIQSVGVGLLFGCVAAFWLRRRHRRKAGEDLCSRCRFQDFVRQEAERELQSREAFQVTVEELKRTIPLKIVNHFKRSDALRRRASADGESSLSASVDLPVREAAP